MSRTPVYTSYTDVINDIKSLQKNGYTMHGNWTLGQICKHLSFYYKGSLDGFPGYIPWIVRFAFGWMIKRQFLSDKPLKKGGATDPKSVFATADDATAVKEALELLQRLNSQKEPLKKSLLLGDLTNDEWQRLHLKHSAHHLGFLAPR